MTIPKNQGSNFTRSGHPPLDGNNREIAKYISATQDGQPSNYTLCHEEDEGQPARPRQPQDIDYSHENEDKDAGMKELETFCCSDTILKRSTLPLVSYLNLLARLFQQVGRSKKELALVGPGSMGKCLQCSSPLPALLFGFVKGLTQFKCHFFHFLRSPLRRVATGTDHGFAQIYCALPRLHPHRNKQLICTDNILP